jgi:hypothetical protein
MLIDLECFWCEGLTGAKVEVSEASVEAKGITEAYSVTMDYTPCAKCQAIWDEGYVLIETTEEPTGMQLSMQDRYPTGDYMVVSRHWIEQRLDEPERAMVLAHDTGRLLLDQVDFEAILDGLRSPKEGPGDADPGA